MCTISQAYLPCGNFYFLSIFLLTPGKVGRTPLWKMLHAFAERSGTLWWKHSTVLWGRNISEDTIQITPFCFGGQNGFIIKILKVIWCPSSCPRPSYVYSFYTFLWRAHCMARWAPLTLFPWSGPQSLTGQLRRTMCWRLENMDQTFR